MFRSNKILTAEFLSVNYSIFQYIITIFRLLILRENKCQEKLSTKEVQGHPPY